MWGIERWLHAFLARCYTEVSAWFYALTLFVTGEVSPNALSIGPWGDVETIWKLWGRNKSLASAQSNADSSKVQTRRLVTIPTGLSQQWNSPNHSWVLLFNACTSMPNCVMFVEDCGCVTFVSSLLEHYTALSRIKILYSWFRASWLCIDKIQQDATGCTYLFTASLHVSCVHHAHHQEYKKM